MDASARFWDRIARKYAARPVGDAQAYEETLARVRAHLTPRMSVLEVGCGTGTTALKLADAAGRITATDYAEGMIAVAREKAAEAGADNVDFQCAGLEAAGGEEMFDAVMAFNLLHLVDDPAAAAAALRERVKPGGLFVSKTICLREASGVVTKLLPALVPVMHLLGKAPRRVSAFKVAELEEMIAAQGFDIIETGSYPASPPSRLVVARRA